MIEEKCNLLEKVRAIEMKLSIAVNVSENISKNDSWLENQEADVVSPSVFPQNRGFQSQNLFFKPQETQQTLTSPFWCY